MKIQDIKVENLISNSNKAIPNQFRIITPEGVYFQSYSTTIAFVPRSGASTILDKQNWNDSTTTTAKYLNLFLRSNRKLIEQNIKSGSYILADLN